MSEPRFKVGDWVRLTQDVTAVGDRGVTFQIGKLGDTELPGPWNRLAWPPEKEGVAYVGVPLAYLETAPSPLRVVPGDPWLRDEHGEPYCPKCKHYVSLHAFGGCFHEGCPCGEIAWPEPEKIAT